MAVDLTCGSDMATFVLFDPGAALDVINGNDGPTPEQLDSAVANGSVVAYSYGSDGDASFRLYVDEPIDPELERHGTETVTGILRVPTGRLVASGAEDLSNPDSKLAATAETFRTRTGTEHVIGAGNYAVTAYELDWGDEPEEAADAAGRAASPIGARIESVLGPVTGLLVVTTFLALLVAIIAVVFGGPSFDELVGLLRLVVPWFAGAWILVIALWVLSPARTVSAARTAAYAKFPCAVVHLHRLADTESLDGRAGCAFGIYYAGELPVATVVKS